MKKHGRNKSIVKKITGFSLAAIVALSSIGLGSLALGLTAQEAYAKEIGHKNEDAYQRCDDVVNGRAPSLPDYSSGEKKTVTWTTGTAPDIVTHTDSADDREHSGETYTYDENGYSTEPIEYENVLGDGSVYRGGNARSNFGAGQMDDDPNDFASVLPYGDVYFDTSKISFGWSGQATNSRPSNDGNFSIDIQDPAFIWTSYKDGDTNNAGTSYSVPVDKNGNSPTMQITNGVDNGDYRNAISYVGGLKAYLSKIDGTPNQDYVNATSEGEWKDTPQEVSSYKYLNTEATDGGYQNVRDAAALGLPYLYQFKFDNAATLPDGTLGNIIITTKKVVIESSIDVDKGAPIGIQQANDIGINMTAINDETGERYIPSSVTLQQGEVTDGPKIVNTSIGVQVYLDVEVVDQEGNSVPGTISYAAYDLDVATSQDFWGRPVGESAANRRMFTESLTITEGSKSYAVVPRYDHKDALTLQAGWIPMGQDAPLYVGQGTEPNKATGVQFASAGENKLRGHDGTFNLTRRNNGADTLHRYTLLNPNAETNNNTQTLGGAQFNRNPELFAQLGFSTLRDLREDQPNLTGNTQANIIRLTGNYLATRTDLKTFDTGFATLLESEKTSFTWAGSSTGVMGTRLFDTSVYVRVDQTHGTGGGIYLESYDLNNSCASVMKEGSVTMGMGADATMTAVPEDGYRVKSFIVGGEGLSNPKKYTLVYGAGGKATGIKDEDGNVTPFTHGKATVDGIDFEVNTDGTVDISLKKISSVKHVHVDFAADYYFYKTWVGEKEPTSLELTAIPYSFKYTFDFDHDGDGAETKFTMQGNTISGGGKSYVVENNIWTIYNTDGTTVSTQYFVAGDKIYDKSPSEEGATVLAEMSKTMIKAPGVDPVTFTVDKNSPLIYETSTEGSGTTKKITWKITYPSEGAAEGDIIPGSGQSATAALPEMSVEKEPASHANSHVDRLYWFVTEKSPGWAMEEYSNANAKAPGVVTDTRYENMHWQLDAVADTKEAQTFIHNSKFNAFMSVFKEGGEIINTPATVIKAEKIWEGDYNNQFETRRDIVMHLDLEYKVGGTTTTVQDILPPQKIAKGATGDDLIVTWGNKVDYTSADTSKKVLGKSAEIPLGDEDNPITYTRGSTKPGEIDFGYHGSDGSNYYINELPTQNADGVKFTYKVRETTVDGDDINVDIAANDPTKGLIGYTTTIEDPEKNPSGPDADGVMTYTGKVTNKLETVDIKVTKNWLDTGITHSKEELLGLLTLYVKGEGAGSAVSGISEYKGADFAYDADAVQIVNPDTGTAQTYTVTWKGLPKYVGYDADIVHEVSYYVTEKKADGHAEPIYTNTDAAVTDKAENGGTITNSQKAKVTVTKQWDDEVDKTNRMDTTYSIKGTWTHDGGSHTYSKDEGPDAIKRAMEDKTIAKDESAEAKADAGSATWIDLPAFSDTGEKITYTVTEQDTDNLGKAFEIGTATPVKEGDKDYGQGVVNDNGELEYKYTITNKLKTVDVEATKVWDDNDDQDGMRQTVVLTISPEDAVLPTGETKTKTIEKDAIDAELTVNWKGLPAYHNGAEVAYTVTEAAIDGYDTNISAVKGETGDFAVEVVNTHIPETASVSVFKAWEDAENQDGLRKDGASVLLEGKTESESQWKSVSTQDGTGITQGAVPTEDGLIITWMNLPVNRNGKQIIYKISEDVSALGGYYTNPDYATEEFTLTNGENKEATITNIQAPELTDITITKEWDDMDDHDGMRPGSVEVILSATYDEITDTTKEINKEVIVNGIAYVVNTHEGTEYFEMDGKYYSADDITEPDKVVEEYSELVDFVPGEDDETVKIEVPDEPKYASKTEDKTITLTAADGWTTTVSDLPVKARIGKAITYSVREDAVPDEYEATVTSTTPGVYTVTNKHEVVINPPVAEPDETINYRGKKQTGTPTFTADPETKAPGGGENKIERITLLDEEGNEVDTVTVPGEGTYVLNEDGTITFTPEPDFVGKTSGVKVRGYDSNGLTAETTYTPTVIMKVEYKDPLSDDPDSPVDEGETDKDVTGKDITTTYEDTPGTESKNHPGYIFDGWDEEVVGSPDDPDGIKIVRTAKYTPMYKITYDPNGGSGVMPDDDYLATDPEKPFKENTFTRDGYTYTGFKAYIKDPATGKETPITDASGNPIIFKSPEDMNEYFKDKPGGTEIRMEAQWERQSYTIKYDPMADDAKGDMPDQHFTGDDKEAKSVKNKFTREGYKFMGFKARDPEGNYIKDAAGNDVIFDDPADFMEYLKAQGDGGEMILEAQWKKLPWATWIDPATGRTIKVQTEFLDDGVEPPAPEDPTRDGYTFDGWDRYVDEDGNVTYSARWKPVEEPPAETYTVTYIDPATGRVIQATVTIPKGDPECPAPPDPTRDGYIFDGWDRVVDENGNITYLAKWKPVEKATEKVTKKTTTKKSPKTGDETNIWLWLVIVILAAGTALFSLKTRSLSRRR